MGSHPRVHPERPASRTVQFGAWLKASVGRTEEAAGARHRRARISVEGLAWLLVIYRLPDATDGSPGMSAGIAAANPRA